MGWRVSWCRFSGSRQSTWFSPDWARFRKRPMLKELRQAVLLLLAVGVLAGIAYPLAVAGLARLIFPYTASGSIIEQGGRPVGSELIGQNFTQARYFHPRPSATA